MNKINVNPNQSLVVIDAMKGFTSEGTFSKTFGRQDCVSIDEAMRRLQKFIDVNAAVLDTRCLVRSVYPAGKFTRDQKSPLYNLCVAGSDDLKDAICIEGQWYIVQKAENDATTEKSFTNWINNVIIKGKKESIIVTGCTLTTCVSQSAMSIRRILDQANAEKTDIIAPLNLIGTRESHAKKMHGQKSNIDLVIQEMRDKRIKVINDMV